MHSQSSLCFALHTYEKMRVKHCAFYPYCHGDKQSALVYFFFTDGVQSHFYLLVALVWITCRTENFLLLLEIESQSSSLLAYE
jgi:hypothetical protein